MDLLGRLPGRQHRLAEGQVVAGDVARHLVEGSAEAHLRRKPVRSGIPVVDDGVELVGAQPGLADPPIDARDDGLFSAELDEDPRPFDRREAVHDGTMGRSSSTARAPSTSLIWCGAEPALRLADKGFTTLSAENVRLERISPMATGV